MIGSCGEPDCTTDCKPFVCKDCSANTLHIDEYYMLTDEVWASIYKKYEACCASDVSRHGLVES